MAHLLVTGGAGYIGSQTLRSLQESGHSAVVVDDLRSGKSSSVAGAPLQLCNVGDRDAIDAVFQNLGPFDGVLHFAASISVPESIKNPLDYYENNVMNGLTLLAATIKHGTPAFLLSSTAAVYGNPERIPIAESHRLAPISPYGASKAMFERILEDVSTARGLRTTTLRYFNASGADPDSGLGPCHEPMIHLIPVALETAAGFRPTLELYGNDYPTEDGTCIRDYIHVRDLADAHVLAIEALLANGPRGVFNLGTGVGYSNLTVLATIERVTRRVLQVSNAPRRPGDPPVLVADTTCFRESFGWEPRFSGLDQIVESTWQWFRSSRRETT